MHTIACAPSISDSFEPSKGVMSRTLASDLDGLENPKPGCVLLISTNTKDNGSSQKQFIKAFGVYGARVDLLQCNRLDLSLIRLVSRGSFGKRAGRSHITKRASAVEGRVKIKHERWSVPTGKGKKTCTTETNWEMFYGNGFYLPQPLVPSRDRAASRSNQ